MKMDARWVEKRERETDGRRNRRSPSHPHLSHSGSLRSSPFSLFNSDTLLAGAAPRRRRRGAGETKGSHWTRGREEGRLPWWRRAQELADGGDAPAWRGGADLGRATDFAPLVLSRVQHAPTNSRLCGRDGESSCGARLALSPAPVGRASRVCARGAGGPDGGSSCGRERSKFSFNLVCLLI